MPTPRARRPVASARGAARRGGMTLLEVVFAVALLALVATAVMTTVTLVITLTLDDKKTLGAHEVAHKLLLQYLDEKKKMPSTGAPIEYGAGRFTYRYRLEETPIEMRTKARESRGGAADLRSDRFKLITVRVFDGVDAGNGFITEGDQLAVMSRMMDPIAITRNPDSMRRSLNSEEGLRELLKSFSGGSGTSTPAQPVARPGRRSRSGGATSAGGSATGGSTSGRSSPSAGGSR